MPVISRAPLPLSLAATVGSLMLATLAACGGGGADAPNAPPPPPPPPPPVTALSGTVAVGAPITGGTLRILDATGAVVAHDIAIDADGHYSLPEVSGTAPWRLEACGYAGGNWRCIYAVAQALGTANVTPLTTALVTLATGDAPEALMQDGASAPSADALSGAQSRLQDSLASTLADAGVPGTLDFTTGTLAAGSRTGYDRVLDAVAVTTGSDNGAFVQLTPRLGDGNVYMTTGSDATSTGTIVPAAGAADMSLASVETLFDGISAAMASADACSNATTGVRHFVADNARMSFGKGASFTGGDGVAQGLCMLFSGAGNDGGEAMWGSRLVSPVLGHCDFTGADPLCGVSLALQAPDGTVQVLGGGVSVVYHGGAFLFYGDATPLALHANAAAQRMHNLDTGVDQYSRALQFDIGHVDGVACAQVFQRDAGGNQTTVAYYKVHEAGAERMSLWVTAGQFGNSPSLDPASGQTRSSDDSWVQLPDGDVGDEVVRNFYRGGRFVTVAAFTDEACATPAVLEGHSEWTIDVDGVPPVWSAMASLPWGSLTDGTTSALKALTLTAGTPSTFDLSWVIGAGSSGYGEATFCVAGDCGDGSVSRLAQIQVRPGATSGHFALRAPAFDVAAGGTKELILGGRDSAGMNMESEFITCVDTAGQGGWCQ